MELLMKILERENHLCESGGQNGKINKAGAGVKTGESQAY